MRNKGFSLIELVIAISIMAILTCVLTPSIISYVEKARVTKDVTTMDEVVNVVMISASHQEVYDELMTHRVFDNVSCYVDSDSESNHEAVHTKIDKDGNISQYTFDNSARQRNGVKYYAAGKMRGVTITFERSNHHNGTQLAVKDAVINKFTDNMVSIEECPYLLSQLTLLIGSSFNISSQTYRNSEFTVFLKLGSTKDNSGFDHDVAAAYGQFSGTNLNSNDTNYTKATKSYG